MERSTICTDVGYRVTTRASRTGCVITSRVTLSFGLSFGFFFLHFYLFPESSPVFVPLHELYSRVPVVLTYPSGPGASGVIVGVVRVTHVDRTLIPLEEPIL